MIHIEQQWNDNLLTAEGELLHCNVDNPFYRQKNGATVTLHSIPIASHELGLYGITDAIELVSSDTQIDSIIHKKYPGFWRMFPIEYKHGKPKSDNVDTVQLTAQIICLEEMYKVHIYEGAIFYAEIRRRQIVQISEELRKLTREIAENMHQIYLSGKTPCIPKSKHCGNCSLLNLCLPGLGQNNKASDYLKTVLYEKTS